MKEYVKPEFFYENFELNMSVAGQCIDATVTQEEKELVRLDIPTAFLHSDNCSYVPEVYNYYGTFS